MVVRKRVKEDISNSYRTAPRRGTTEIELPENEGGLSWGEHPLLCFISNQKTVMLDKIGTVVEKQ